MNRNNIVRSLNLTFCAMILSSCASLDSKDPAPSISEYQYTLSSGLFSLPQGARSVDWAVVNNSTNTQQFRVTVYRFDTSGKVPVAPGPLTNTVEPSQVFHNANSVGPQKPFTMGMDLEVVLEVNSLKVLPSVEVWADHGNTVIPGTRIGPGQFVDIGE